MVRPLWGTARGERGAPQETGSRPRSASGGAPQRAERRVCGGTCTPRFTQRCFPRPRGEATQTNDKRHVDRLTRKHHPVSTGRGFGALHHEGPRTHGKRDTQSHTNTVHSHLPEVSNAARSLKQTGEWWLPVRDEGARKCAGGEVRIRKTKDSWSSVSTT